MTDPRIEHYTAERIPNPNPDGDVSWQLYHSVRNAVVRCCRKFGAVGPGGECPITADDEPDHWPPADPDPLDYFVVEDQYNHERYAYVEIVRPGAFTGDWLRELVLAMAQFPGWGVGIMAFEKAYILVFADRLMVTGDIFAMCDDFDAVVHSGEEYLASRG